MNSKILAPSLLSADFSSLADAVGLCERKGAGCIHIDVMDGHFVPQISYGQPLIKSIRKLTRLPFDVHLMVDRPDDMIDSFAAAGADWITFHAEAAVHIDRIISHIRSLGKKAGVSIVPSTPVSVIKEVLPLVDLVLVMTVNPGFGGQKFIPYCADKVKELDSIRKEKGLEYLVSVDGGINSQNAKVVLGLGADIVVSGSAFFNGSFEWEGGN